MNVDTQNRMVRRLQEKLTPLGNGRALCDTADLDDAEVAVARTSERAHPVFCLCRVTLLDHLTAFFEGGGRKVEAWYSSLDVTEVDFADQADAFRNINTLEELAALEQQRYR